MKMKLHKNLAKKLLKLSQSKIQETWQIYDNENCGKRHAYRSFFIQVLKATINSAIVIKSSALC